MLSRFDHVKFKCILKHMNKRLPVLKNYHRTLESLREALQPLRSARFAGCTPMPNKLEYSVLSRPYGASTGELSFGGELQLNYVMAEIRYVKDKEIIFTISLNGENQVSLADKVFAKFKDNSCEIDPKREKITETTEFEINPEVARNYAEIQHRIATSLSKVGKRLTGSRTDATLWPHGFDLSLLWFKEGKDEMTDPHMNFGFSPGLGDDEPYLYFYVWPAPKKLTDIKLADGGQWQSTWNAPGARFGYSMLLEEDDPDNFIEELFLKLYRQTEPLLKKTD